MSSLRFPVLAVVALAAALLFLPRLQQTEERAQFDERLLASRDHFVCAGYGFIDDGAAFDGPSYYFREDTRALVSTCGGACWHPDLQQAMVCRTLCPPPEWKAGGCIQSYDTWLAKQNPRR